MEGKQWEVLDRPFQRYVVQILVWSDALGSGYRFARDAYGKVRKFWTQKGAQAYADALNAEDKGWEQ